MYVYACRVSGCVDHFAKNEEESYDICRDVILSLNLPDVQYPTSSQQPLYDIEDLNGIVSPDNPNAHQVGYGFPLHYSLHML